MSATTTNYKKMARSLKKENDDLKGQITTHKTNFVKILEVSKESEKHMKLLLKDYKTKTQAELQQVKDDLEDTRLDCQTLNHHLTALYGAAGVEQVPEDLIKWVEERAVEYADEKTHHDAVRMFGELQVKFNLLTEEMAEHLAKNAPKASKKQKGLSGQHRKEDCDAGVLRPHQVSRCSAVSWANGLAQQCSRHWDKHDDGKMYHLCKTHHKLVNEEGQYTGSWGLYHQKRPTCWGDHGLKVQNEWKKMIGKPINYKLKTAPYEEQFAAMVAQVGDEVPRLDYPELTCQPCAPVEEEEVVFSSDDEDDESDDESISSAEMVVSDDEDEEDEPIAPQAIIVPHDAPEDFIAPDTLELEADESDEEAFPKQDELDRLEKLNEGAISVDYDVLMELRDEKEEWEQENGADTPGASDEEPMVECFSCSEEMCEKAAHYPFEDDEPYCHECAEREKIALGKTSNCLAASTDEDDDDQ